MLTTMTTTMNTRTNAPAPSFPQRKFLRLSGHSRRLLLALLGLLMFACVGCDESGEETKSDVDAASENDVVVADTYAIFDLDAAREGDDTFFDFPLPNELRTLDGKPDLTGFPGVRGGLEKDAVDLVMRERVGWSPVGASYFRFDGELDPASFPTPAETMAENGSVQLIDIDPNSPELGRRVPVYVSFRSSNSKYWRGNVLTVRAVPGLHMRTATKYAVAVTSRIENKGGAPVLRAPGLQAALDGDSTNEVNDYVKDLFNTLEEAGVDTDEVVTATSFTTSDVVVEMDALRTAALAHGASLVASDWEVGEEKSAYIEYVGTFETVEFFSGEPGYTSPFGDGAFEFEADGTPKHARTSKVRFSVSVPKKEMPAGGFPMAIYGHGTGGSAKSHLGNQDEGAWLATEGIATLGFDGALHAEREGATDLEAMIVTNAVGARDAVRQTVVDQMLAYQILADGGFTIPAETTGGEAIHFDSSYGFYMGHSQGSQEAGLLLAVEPEVKSAFLSAGGGGTVISILDREYQGQPIACAISAVLGINCDDFTADHPVSMLVIQPLLDPADPLHFARRFIKESPYAGFPAKHIAMSEGTIDKLTPPRTQEALAVAIGLDFMNPVSSVSDIMELAQIEGKGAPFKENVTSHDGKVTGGIIQHEGEGHFAIYEKTDARLRYVSFFASALADPNKVPTIPGPK